MKYRARKFQQTPFHTEDCYNSYLGVVLSYMILIYYALTVYIIILILRSYKHRRGESAWGSQLTDTLHTQLNILLYMYLR